MGPKTLCKTYQKRIVRIMEAIRQQCIKAGWICTEVDFWEADQYSWCFMVHTHGEPAPDAEPDSNFDMDVRFDIRESEYWDGSEGGVTFAVDITAWGGRMIGGLCPYNYTDEVWVKRTDKQAVDARFQIFVEADPQSVVDTIQHYLREYHERTACQALSR